MSLNDEKDMDDIQRTVCGLFRQVTSGASGPTEIELSTDFRDELGVDSIALLSLIFILEQRFKLDMFALSERIAESRVVDDIASLVKQAINAQQEGTRGGSRR